MHLRLVLHPLREDFPGREQAVENFCQRDLPDGQFCNFSVQPLTKKFFSFPFGRSSSRAKSSRPNQGAFRDRHGRGAGCNGRVARD
jgi:hypothetical protein